MCTNCQERQIAINAVESLWKHNGERWAVIIHKGGMLEEVPEISLKSIDLKENQIIYTLKDYNYV